eukprot:9252766-Pyramimonas_sp.AAC.1
MSVTPCRVAQAYAARWLTTRATDKCRRVGCEARVVAQSARPVHQEPHDGGRRSIQGVLHGTHPEVLPRREASVVGGKGGATNSAPSVACTIP